MTQHFIPREWGAIATDFLFHHPRCNLWAVPGMGKTGIVYSLIDLLKLAGSNYFPVLVIAPKKVCELTWPSEQKKWDIFSDISVVPILGEAQARDDALMRRGDVFVINYENVQWLVDRLGKRWPFKIVVADESTKLKGYRVNAGRKRASALAEIAEQTGRWINLTGTPSPNGLKDLWGQNWFVDFGQRLYPTYTQFMNRWFFQNAYDKSIEPRGSAEAEIHAALADVTLALRAEDWMDVRKPQCFMREVELPGPTRALYDRMERDFFIELDALESKHEVTAVNSAALSTKLLQMASSGVFDGDKAWHHLHDAKIENLRSLMDELAGEPLLVSYWFKNEAPLLQKAFPEMRMFRTKQDEDDWNAGKIPLMGIHPMRGGHGTNLQYGGRAMAFFTQTWDLELRQQVIERIGPVRQLQAGFDRAVLIYDITARATLDQEVLERTDSKRSVQDALMLARSLRRGDRLPWSDLA